MANSQRTTLLLGVSGFLIYPGNKEKIEKCFIEIEKEIMKSISNEHKNIKISFQIISSFFPGENYLEIKSSSENISLSRTLSDPKLNEIVKWRVYHDLKSDLIDAKIEQIYWRVGSNFEHWESSKFSETKKENWIIRIKKWWEKQKAEAFD